MEQESAEIVALQALTWIAADPEILGAFQIATGATSAMIVTRAADAEFHGAILDFLLMDDHRVVGFCDAVGLAYTIPMRARMSLPGGKQENWT